MIRYLKKGKDAQARADDDVQVRATVEAILKDVQARGDEANASKMSAREC